MMSQHTHAGSMAPGPGHPQLPGRARGRLAVRGVGTLVAASAALMLATALASPAPVASASATARSAAATAVPRCLENELTAGLYGYEGSTQGRNRQGGFILTLTNDSQQSCAVYGYPGLGLQNASHHVLRSKTHWGSTLFARDPGPHTIVLSPGETASASVTFAYVGASHALHAAYLEITPPNGYDHAVVPIPDGLGNISDGNLYVTAMARHTAYKYTPQHCCGY